MKDPFGTTFNPFSSSFREKLNDVGEYAIDWHEKGDDLQARLNELNPLATMPYGPPQVRMCQLNDAASLSSAVNRWKYAWEVYVPGVAASARGFPGQGANATAANTGAGAWAPLQGRMSSMLLTDKYGLYAVNGAEVDNVDTGAEQSYGVHTSTSSPEVTLMAIGNLAGPTDGTEAVRQVIVPMFWVPDVDSARGVGAFWFSAGNDVKVVC
jgi:hypothetical protein